MGFKEDVFQMSMIVGAVLGRDIRGTGGEAGYWGFLHDLMNTDSGGRGMLGEVDQGDRTWKYNTQSMA